MSRPKRLADRAVVIALGNAVQSLGNALISIVLSRILIDPAAFGSYRQIWLVFQTFIPFFMLGLPHAVYFFVPALERPDRRRFMAGALGYLSLTGLLFSIAVFLGAAPIASLLSNPSLVPVLRAFALYPLFTLPSMLLFPYLVSIDRHTRATAINLSFFVVQSAVIIALAAVGCSLAVIFASIVGLSGLRLAYSVFETVRQSEPGTGAGPAETRPGRLFSYSIPVGLSTVATVLGQKLDRFVVSALLGTAQFGIYAVGAVEFPGIVLVSMAANTVMRPHISKLHHEGKGAEIYRFWLDAYRKQSLVLTPIAVFFAVFAREFIGLLYPPQYIGATTVFQIYLALFLTRNANPEVVLTSIGLTREVLAGTLLFLAVNLGLNLVLVRWMGMTGPPLATVLAMAALTSAYAWRVSRYLSIAWHRLFPVAVMGRSLALSLIAVGGAVPVKLVPAGNLVALVLGGVVFSILYVTVGIISGVLTRTDLELARRWLRLEWMRGGIR